MQAIEVNGIKICFEHTGSGAPMLFIGGTGWDMRQYPNPLGSILAQQFDFILYDQRGMGRSGKPRGPYTMAQFAEDASQLITAMDWRQAHVVGYSFGGMVAQELAIRFPEKITSLVLAATTPGGGGGSSYPIQDLLQLDPLDRARRGLEIADTRFTPQWQARNPEAAARRVEERAKKQAQFAHEPGAREAFAAQLLARSTHDAFSRLTRITAPTLVLAGQNDGQAPLPAQDRMAEQIPNCKLVKMAGSHNFIQESDDAYREIAAFCMQHS
jgi:3-oxoadipate enol-lactonase